MCKSSGQTNCIFIIILSSTVNADRCPLMAFQVLHQDFLGVFLLAHSPSYWSQHLTRLHGKVGLEEDLLTFPQGNKSHMVYRNNPNFQETEIITVNRGLM